MMTTQHYPPTVVDGFFLGTVFGLIVAILIDWAVRLGWCC